MNIAQTKKSLLEKKISLTERISAIENDLKKGRSQDFAEQTTESENDQVLDEIRLEAKAELANIIDALARIEKGVYGTCAICDEPIPPARLAVLPYTNTCVSCANKI
jgi:RNA polymerase-binding transcription factor DksA